MADKQPDLAQLEREGTRLHHCLATEGLSSRDADGDYDGDRRKDADDMYRKARTKPDDDAKPRGGDGY